MAGFFTINEQKIRPGVYNRYENYGTIHAAGADDGKCACVLRSDWGPTGKVSIFENIGDISKIYGSGGTADVAAEQFKGGARLVYAVRLGSGGTKGTYKIMNDKETPENVINLEMKYEGSRKFSVSVRPALADAEKKEFLLLDGTNVIEKFTFESGENEIENLIAAASESEYFTLTKSENAAGSVAAVNQAEITAGADPTVNTEAYSAAFELLECYRWNVLAVDTSDTAVHLLMQLFLNRILDSGKFAVGVIGEEKSVKFEDRLAHSRAFNDKQIIYVGNGFKDTSGRIYDGFLAAARVAGIIAGTPSNKSITHITVAGAADLTEPLTNNQYERAIKSGMLTFSLSAENAVWIESGINTLVSPVSDEDDGWKKIKRTKVRFELMQRLNDIVEPLVGRINNDSDGRMTIIQVSNDVCNSMAAEKKLLAGAHCELDPDNTPKGDSAWFLIYADDIDALEKMYFTFKFRFTPEETE